jgi:hypothetical protein
MENEGGSRMGRAFSTRRSRPGLATGRLEQIRGVRCRMRLSTPVLIFITAFSLSTCPFVVSAFAQTDVPAPTQTPDTQSPAPQAPASTYTPKFHGDPARSDSEAAALGYIRVVMRAEVGFNKQYGHYALTLAQLVHSGTFTQRMLNPDRGDYTVGYKGKKDNFMLTLTPKNLDPQHRSFYVENDGKIHAEETKAADADSPVVETHHF